MVVPPGADTYGDIAVVRTSADGTLWSLEQAADALGVADDAAVSDKLRLARSSVTAGTALVLRAHAAIEYLATGDGVAGPDPRTARRTETLRSELTQSTGRLVFARARLVSFSLHASNGADILADSQACFEDAALFFPASDSRQRTIQRYAMRDAVACNARFAQLRWLGRGIGHVVASLVERPREFPAAAHHLLDLLILQDQPQGVAAHSIITQP